MDFLKKISDVFKNLLPSKKNQDNINVPPASPAPPASEPMPAQEKPLEETAQEPEQEPIKQNFEAPEGEEKGL